MEPFEEILVRCLESFLAARDRANEHEESPALASAVAYFVHVLLQERPDWSKYRYVDGFVWEFIHPVGQMEVDLGGVLVWGGDAAKGQSSPQWIEPFAGSLRLAPEAAGGVTFDLGFGDPSIGLKQVPFGTLWPDGWPVLDAWLFTFRSEPDAPAG